MSLQARRAIIAYHLREAALANAAGQFTFARVFTNLAAKYIRLAEREARTSPS